MSHTPAILLFAEPDQYEGDTNTIYKYLADAGFDENEVKSWGNIGSLVEALKEADQPDPPRLDQSFVDFVAKLPSGNTPRPVIRSQIQKYVPN